MPRKSMSPGGSELTGNAETTEVLVGKTFYKDNPNTKLTGALEPNPFPPNETLTPFDSITLTYTYEVT